LSAKRTKYARGPNQALSAANPDSTAAFQAQVSSRGHPRSGAAAARMRLDRRRNPQACGAWSAASGPGFVNCRRRYRQAVVVSVGVELQEWTNIWKIKSRPFRLRSLQSNAHDFGV